MSKKRHVFAAVLATMMVTAVGCGRSTDESGGLNSDVFRNATNSSGTLKNSTVQNPIITGTINNSTAKTPPPVKKYPATRGGGVTSPRVLPSVPPANPTKPQIPSGIQTHPANNTTARATKPPTNATNTNTTERSATSRGTTNTTRNATSTASNQTGGQVATNKTGVVPSTANGAATVSPKANAVGVAATGSFAAALMGRIPAWTTQTQTLAGVRISVSVPRNWMVARGSGNATHILWSTGVHRREHAQLRVVRTPATRESGRRVDVVNAFSDPSIHWTHVAADGESGTFARNTRGLAASLVDIGAVRWVQSSPATYVVMEVVAPRNLARVMVDSMSIHTSS